MEKYKANASAWILWCLLCFWLPVNTHGQTEFISVAYHDVVENRSEVSFDAVTLDNLIDHFEWLKVSGYHPISIDDLLAAKTGTRQLPDRPILLCFDDGYSSFYDRVLPLLKAYKYPAVLALVGAWMEPAQDEMVQYGNTLVSRKKFMSWEKLQEVRDSGLVEIASHSNNLHNEILASQYGDMLPAAIAHRYDPASGTYETDQHLKKRVREDLQASSDLILQHLGFRPRVLVWPFGRYNKAAQVIAAEIGMSITLTLDPVPADINYLQAAGRIYATRNPDLKTFRSYLDLKIRPEVKHFFRVDSRDILEKSASQEHNFGIFLDRVKNLNPNMVVLDPVIAEEGIHKTLFANRRYPLAQDRLMRISWHTAKRAGAGVFLRLSSTLFSSKPGETEAMVNDFFSDMGKSAPGEGLVIDNPELIQALFHAVAYDSGQEAVVRYWNPDKRRRARKAIILAGDSPQITGPFQALEAFQQWQPFQEVSLLLATDIFRGLDLKQVNILLRFFDFLVVDCGQDSVKTYTKSLRPQLQMLQTEGYLRKIAFLFSIDDRGEILSRELARLPDDNIINWGYQYDRFLEDNPPSASIKAVLSKTSFPYPLR